MYVYVVDPMVKQVVGFIVKYVVFLVSLDEILVQWIRVPVNFIVKNILSLLTIRSAILETQ